MPALFGQRQTETFEQPEARPRPPLVGGIAGPHGQINLPPEVVMKQLQLQGPRPGLEAMSIGLTGVSGGQKALESRSERRLKEREMELAPEREASAMRSQLALEGFKAQNMMEKALLSEVEKNLRLQQTQQGKEDIEAIRAKNRAELEAERAKNRNELLVNQQRHREKMARMQDVLIKGRQQSNAAIQAQLIRLRSDEVLGRTAKKEAFDIQQKFVPSVAALDDIESSLQAVVEDPSSIKAILNLRAKVISYTRPVGRGFGERGAFTDRDAKNFEQILSPGVGLTLAEIAATGDAEIAFDRVNQAKALLADIVRRETDALERTIGGVSKDLKKSKGRAAIEKLP